MRNRFVRNSKSVVLVFNYKKYFLLIAFILVAWGCVSARMSDSASTRLFREGRYAEAAQYLEEGLKKQGDSGTDALLYLLDLGLALHTAGKYDASNRVFLRADQLAEIKDYTSLAAEGATLLTSDNIKDYRAEDFEYVMISVYLAINYTLLGDTENALVEARRVNRKLHLMVTEGKRNYKQNAFARYLSGILYEADGDWNNAYVDYKKAYELEPGFINFKWDLWRISKLLGESVEQQRWNEQFSLSAEDHALAMKSAPRSGLGELIVIYQNGISPVKRPNPDFRSLPKFFPRYNPVQHAQVQVIASIDSTVASGSTASQELDLAGASVDTRSLFDVEAVAVQNLEEKYGRLIAKKIAGVVAKEVVADQIGKQTKNEFLGLLAKLFFYASDQADVRSWSLLPHDFQIARIPLKPGVYEVELRPVGVGANLPKKKVMIQSKRKTFLNFRYMP